MYCRKLHSLNSLKNNFMNEDTCLTENLKGLNVTYPHLVTAVCVKCCK